MGKSQADKISGIISNGDHIRKKLPDLPTEEPPQIPPRMKKKGPALPEKPQHMRPRPVSPPSSHPPREPLRPRTLPNPERQQGIQREILVAASRAARERPVEKRQREPAKLLTPTSGMPSKKDFSILPSKSVSRLEDCLSYSTKKAEQSKNPAIRKSRPPQPVLLIPRNLLTWGSAPPVSYALWMQRDAAPSKGAPRREPVKLQVKDKLEASTTSARARSGSVARSGSLTSQGSSSSDSGNETFPKSVLKKQKRATPSTTSKGTSRKIDQKKNVTFNAFATVQLMGE